MAPSRWPVIRADLPFPSCRPSPPTPPQRPRLPVSLVLGAVVAGCAVSGPGPSVVVDGALGAGPPAIAPVEVPERTGDRGVAPGSAPGIEPLKLPTPAPALPGLPLPAPTLAPSAPPLPASEGTLLPDQATAVLQLSNGARAQAGLPPLAADARLASLAETRSRDMGDRNYFAHATPEGESIFDFLPELGIRYFAAGENIALNTAAPTSTARVAFDGWMGSSGHKANILRSTFGRLGVGVYRTPGGKTYLTQVFTD